MPKPLLQRLRIDSVQEFRRSAFERIEDGYRLAAADRRLGAIYLWGYATEMLLKSAYFSAVGFKATDPVAIADLNNAKNQAPSLQFQWIGNLHSLESWSRLLVNSRASHPTANYASQQFGTQVIYQARNMGVLWRETLRYRANQAYQFEVQQARLAVEWFEQHWEQL